MDNRTIEDIQKDIELLGIKGGYDIEQLLTPQDCRRLSYEIERLNNIIKHTDSWINRTIEIIKQQPSGNDEWILERLNGIKLCLKESDKE